MNIVDFITGHGGPNHDEWVVGSPDSVVATPDRRVCYPQVGDKFSFVAEVDPSPVPFDYYGDASQTLKQATPTTGRFVKMKIIGAGYDPDYKTALESIRFYEVGDQLIGQMIDRDWAAPLEQVTNIIAREQDGTDSNGVNFQRMSMDSWWSSGVHGRYICPT